MNRFQGAGVVGTFAIAQTTHVRIEAAARLVLDAPVHGATIDQPFMVAGWAIDGAAASGGGVDIVHVYAYPLDVDGSPVFLGQASVNGPRPDVAAAFGAQFDRAGFGLFASGLRAGRYRVVAYGRSLVAGTFAAAATADVTVR
jgi:hypothetical protein